jgi:hypothetical protein
MVSKWGVATRRNNKSAEKGFLPLGRPKGAGGSNGIAVLALLLMPQFFLALIVIAVAVLIGMFIFATFAL